MTTYYTHNLDFGTREEPVKRFVGLVKALLSLPVFGPECAIWVYKYDPPHHYAEETEEKVILDASYMLSTDELFQRFFEQYRGEKYQFEGIWTVRRCTSAEYDDPEEDQTVVRVCVRGAEFEPYLNQHFPTGIYYEAGADRYFLGSQFPEITRKNMKLLTGELTVLAQLGAVSITGHDRELLFDPRTYSLCYHHQPAGFLNDLRVLDGDFLAPASLKAETIIETALECENVTALQVSTGVMIYHLLGASHNLADFYRALRNKLSR